MHSTSPTMNMSVKNGTKQQSNQRTVHITLIPRQFRSQNHSAKQADKSAWDIAGTWQAVQQVEVFEETHYCPRPRHHHCVGTSYEKGNQHDIMCCIELRRLCSTTLIHIALHFSLFQTHMVSQNSRMNGGIRRSKDFNVQLGAEWVSMQEFSRRNFSQAMGSGSISK